VRSRSDASFLSVAGDGFWAAVIHDPLPIGLVAVGLVAGTSVLLDVVPSGPLLLAAFSGTALVYGIDRVLSRSPEDRLNRPERVAWRRRRGGVFWVEGAGLVGALVYALLHLRPATIGVAAVLGAVGVLHSVRALPGGRRLKALGGIKPFIVAGVWSVGAVALPVVEARAPVTVAVGALCAYRFVFILPNILLADWADREGDAAAGLNPWAVRWSRHSLRVVSTTLLGMGVLGAGIGVFFLGASVLLLVDAVGYGLMVLGVWRLSPEVSSAHAFLLDFLVAWPIVVWGVQVLGVA